MENLIKICRTCKEEKTIDWYYFRNDTNQYRASCKKCLSEKKGYQSLKLKLNTINDLLLKGLKECKTCLEIKNLDKFNVDNNSITKKTNNCKECVAKYSKNNRHINKERRLKNIYNLSLEDYKYFIVKQENKCAICKIRFDQINLKEVHVDHSHVTGKVRGILCRSCNQAIGFMDDNIQNLENAIKYLKENN